MSASTSHEVATDSSPGRKPGDQVLPLIPAPALAGEKVVIA